MKKGEGPSVLPRNVISLTLLDLAFGEAAHLVEILDVRYVDLLKQPDGREWRVQYVYVVLLMPEDPP